MIEIGDEVWFFFTDMGTSNWGADDVIVYPEYLSLLKGTIVHMSSKDDYVHVYIEGNTSLITFGYVFRDDNLFKTKDDALAAMRLRLEVIENMGVKNSAMLRGAAV